MITEPTVYRDYAGKRYYTWLLVPHWWSPERARTVYRERYQREPARVERVARPCSGHPITIVRVGPVSVDDAPPRRCSFHRP